MREKQRRVLKSQKHNINLLNHATKCRCIIMLSGSRLSKNPTRQFCSDQCQICCVSF